MAELQIEAENAEELRFGPIFGKPNVQALSNSEALYILSAVEQTRKEAEPSFVPTPMVQQTKQYLERFNSVKNKAATDAMRASMQGAGLQQFEVCSVINLLPSSCPEVKALIPSVQTMLERFEEEEELETLLNTIQTLKEI